MRLYPPAWGVGRRALAIRGGWIPDSGGHKCFFHDAMGDASRRAFFRSRSGLTRSGGATIRFEKAASRDSRTFLLGVGHGLCIGAGFR